MAATKSDIEAWFDKGKKSNHNFMIVVCDTFEYDDYPVYVNENEFEEKYREYDGKNMQRIMEVYNLKMDKQTQLDTTRCFNFPKNFTR